MSFAEAYARYHNDIAKPGRGLLNVEIARNMELILNDNPDGCDPVVLDALDALERFATESLFLVIWESYGTEYWKMYNNWFACSIIQMYEKRVDCRSGIAYAILDCMTTNFSIFK